MSKKNGNGEATLDIGVEFGTNSNGKETSRIGFKISREALGSGALNKVDKLLCGKQLEGFIAKGGKDDTAGQMTFDSMDDDKLEATFDCHRLGFNAEEITGGLTFNCNAIDPGKLAKFAGCSGRIVATCKGDIPAKERNGHGGDDDERGLYHEDVEAGKLRPHGHPALTAAAQAHADAESRQFLLGSPLTELIPDIPAPWVQRLADKLVTKMSDLLDLIDADNCNRKTTGFAAANLETLKSAALAWRARRLPAKDPTQAEIDAAYKAGCEAAADGKPHDDCPHPTGPLSEAWARGFDETNGADDLDDVPDEAGE